MNLLGSGCVAYRTGWSDCIPSSQAFRAMMLDLGMAPLLGQSTSWLSAWLTPIWYLSVGFIFGFLVLGIYFAILAGLSRIPALGNLAENRKRGHLAAAGLSALLAVGLVAWIVPNIDDVNRVYAVAPLVAASMILGWSTIFGMWRRTIKELPSIVKEGILGYSLLTVGCMAIIGILPTYFVAEPMAALRSLPQVFTMGTESQTVRVEGASLDETGDAAPFVARDVDYELQRISELRIESNRSIMLADAASPENFEMDPVRIEPGEPLEWKIESNTVPPVPLDSSDGVYIQNREIDEAEVTFTFTTRPAVPHAATIPVFGGFVVLFTLLYISLRQAAPRVSAVALSTSKSEVAQPLFTLLMALGAVALALFLIMPFNTLGEDIKVLKDSGLTLIMVFGIIQAVWAASTGVSEEIEGRTALTVLSKPVSRRSFLLGKFLGIGWTVFFMFLLLGLLLLVLVAYKPIHEAREISAEQPEWTTCFAEMVTTLPGLTLLFMETMLLAAISTAIATRLPMLANFVVCFTIYILGNLTAPIVQSSAQNFEIVRFVGRLIAVVVPNLDSFNIQAAVDAGNPIPVLYVAAAFTYLICFGVVVLMIGLLLFEDRDLA